MKTPTVQETTACRGSDDVGVNRSTEPTFGDIVVHRYSRRAALKGLSAGAALAALGPLPTVLRSASAETAVPSSLTFTELAHGMSEDIAVADGYVATTLIRWGDPVEKGAPPFDPEKQTAAAQAKQWGYNNDFLAFMPLPAGSRNAGHGLLCANFEYTNYFLMFPGIKEGELEKLSREQVDIELAAHGHGVVEIKRDNKTGEWAVVANSPYNRRISMLLTECRFSGPAAGHQRLKTANDPSGTKVVGTLNNCAGGKTPWNTVLSAEENFHQYFGGDPDKTAEARNLKRYGIKPRPEYAWYLHYDRFNVEKEPNEANKFGWVVEIDPYDPQSVPIKRTALGRFKHEAATCVINKDGRVVVYSGDDERYEYIYKFVTNGKFDGNSPAKNRDLLDNGTLFVAKFSSDGRVAWLPLVFGSGPLTVANGFHSQADVLIETRRAADLVGATPMDRPEDIEANPRSGLVYTVLTNNVRRTAEKVDSPNPRGPNDFGHIIELIPPGNNAADRDHAAPEFAWEMFILCGDPARPEHGARYHPATSANGWLASPDNLAFDNNGRMWIATDGAPRFGIADGAYGCDTQGTGRALPRHFYRTPIGAELCGPELNADDTAYFAAVQHPGETTDSTFDNPSTRWPDFKPDVPPRPSVQVIVKKNGGVIGS
jgi:hypothetical protein